MKTTIPDRFWMAMGIPAPTPEYKFLPNRKSRFDYAWPIQKVAVEIEGGVFIQGRHTRGLGYINDMVKYNLATVNGWRLLRYTPDAIDYEQIRLVLQAVKRETILEVLNGSK